YAATVARRLDWQVIVGGHSGTGFVEPGRIGKSFIQLFEEQMYWRPAPDMLIVSGGHNDRSHPPSLVQQADEELLYRLERRWPLTQLVTSLRDLGLVASEQETEVTRGRTAPGWSGHSTRPDPAPRAGPGARRPGR